MDTGLFLTFLFLLFLYATRYPHVIVMSFVLLFILSKFKIFQQKNTNFQNFVALVVQL